MGIFKYALENCLHKSVAIQVDLKLVLAHKELKVRNSGGLE